jgi:hypothetical protein
MLRALSFVLNRFPDSNPPISPESKTLDKRLVFSGCHIATKKCQPFMVFAL